MSGDRVAIVRRLWRTAEAQVRDIEGRLRQDQQQPDERERDARMLAVLVKTLRELSALDEFQGATPTTAGDDDEVPRDIDEFRRELARRIDAFVAARTADPRILATERPTGLRTGRRLSALMPHDHQQAPVLARNGRPWRTWLMLGGRGAGKTRAGAEWVRAHGAGDAYADAASAASRWSARPSTTCAR